MKPLVIMFVVAGVMAALSLIFLFVLLALAGITIAVLIYGLIHAIREARKPPRQSMPDWLVSRRQVVAMLPPGIREDFQTKEWPAGWTTNRAIAEGLIP